MYKSFNIENFRCFSELTLKPLERINLIAGKNNIGKTALLEALWMHHGYQNPELGIRVDGFRGLGPFKEDEMMSSIFRDFDQQKQIVLASTNTQNRKARLTITRKEERKITVPVDMEQYKQRRGRKLPSNNSEIDMSVSTGKSKPEIIFEYTPHKGGTREAKAYFANGDLQFEQGTKLEPSIGIYLASNHVENPKVIAERFGNLEVNKAENDIIQMLQIIAPDLNRLAVRLIAGIPTIYADIGIEKMIPLPLMGDGITRLLRIALAITDASKGIVLIDEIENGLHYTVMKNVWKAIAYIARKYSSQVFATTHSRECIQAAHEAFTEEKKYDFLLHRLELLKGRFNNVVYDQEALEAAVKAKFEVR